MSSRPGAGRTAPLPLVVGGHLALLLVTMLVLYPVLWVVRIAVLVPVEDETALVAEAGPDGTPGAAERGADGTGDAAPTEDDGPQYRVSLDNFREVTGTRDAGGGWLFGRQLLNSLLIAAATTAVGISLATTAAYAFSRFRFPGREAGMQAFLLTQMFPGVVMAIPLYILMDTLGLLDSLTGLILVYSTSSVPFCVWTLKGYFDTIPRELEEAAWLDGATRWMTFTRVVLPLSLPAVSVTALFSFMTAWNEFILAATFMSDERSFTLPVALQRYVGDFATDWPAFAAGAILVSLPVMGLFLVLQRNLVSGLTAGGVKG